MTKKEKNNSSKSIVEKYMKALREKTSRKRITKEYQSTGLALAQILQDEEHKSLYIKLAKEYDNNYLIGTAKNIAERPNVENKGAYFMKVIYESDSSKTN